MSITRSDQYVRSESGGEVMDELFCMLSKTSSDTPLQDLLSAINNKRTENVSDVVTRYREETGLDLVLSEAEEEIKAATPDGSNLISKRSAVEDHAELTQHKLHQTIQSWKDVEHAFTQLYNELVVTDETLADKLYDEMWPIEVAMKETVQAYNQSDLYELLGKIRSKFISKRHKLAAETQPHPVLNNPDACRDIESYCSCSGGHKSPHAIILALREKLGREDISYTDPELIKFIEDHLAKHKQTCPSNKLQFEVGQVGTQKSDSYEDQVADYFKHSK